MKARNIFANQLQLFINWLALCNTKLRPFFHILTRSCFHYHSHQALLSNDWHNAGHTIESLSHSHCHPAPRHNVFASLNFLKRRSMPVFKAELAQVLLAIITTSGTTEASFARSVHVVIH